MSKYDFILWKERALTALISGGLILALGAFVIGTVWAAIYGATFLSEHLSGL